MPRLRKEHISARGQPQTIFEDAEQTAQSGRAICGRGGGRLLRAAVRWPGLPPYHRSPEASPRDGRRSFPARPRDAAASRRTRGEIMVRDSPHRGTAGCSRYKSGPWALAARPSVDLWHAELVPSQRCAYFSYTCTRMCPVAAKRKYGVLSNWDFSLRGAAFHCRMFQMVMVRE